MKIRGTNQLKYPFAVREWSACMCDGMKSRTATVSEQDRWIEKQTSNSVKIDLHADKQSFVNACAWGHSIHNCVTVLNAARASASSAESHRAAKTEMFAAKPDVSAPSFLTTSTTALTSSIFNEANSASNDMVKNNVNSFFRDLNGEWSAAYLIIHEFVSEIVSKSMVNETRK